MHVADSAFCKLRLRVQNIGNATIRHEVFVHRHLQFLDFAIVAEDFAQMCFFDILREFLDDNLCAAWEGWWRG